MRQAGARVRIAIADPHDLYRRGMLAVLGAEPDIDVVAGVESVGEAVTRCVELDPDVVILGHRPPGNNAIEACRAVAAQAPRTSVLILTSSDNDADLVAAMQAGAMGYLLKEVPSQQIVASVRLVHGGQSVIPSHMATQLVGEMSRLSQAQPEEPDLAARLTERELGVLNLLAQGRANKEIAAQLSISHNTVKNHIRNIRSKLKLRTRVDLALHALGEGSQ